MQGKYKSLFKKRDIFYNEENFISVKSAAKIPSKTGKKIITIRFSSSGRRKKNIQ